MVSGAATGADPGAAARVGCAVGAALGGWSRTAAAAALSTRLQAKRRVRRRDVVGAGRRWVAMLSTAMAADGGGRCFCPPWVRGDVGVSGPSTPAPLKRVR